MSGCESGFLALGEEYRLTVSEDVASKKIFDPRRDTIKGIYVITSFLILLEQ
jgi:hypothetical protein